MVECTILSPAWSQKAFDLGIMKDGVASRRCSVLRNYDLMNAGYPFPLMDSVYDHPDPIPSTPDSHTRKNLILYHPIPYPPNPALTPSFPPIPNPLTTPPSAPTQSSWGRQTDSHSAYENEERNGQREREAAQRDFDRMLDAERQLSHEEGGDNSKKKGWRRW